MRSVVAHLASDATVEHLIVLAHGIDGEAKDLHAIRDEIQRHSSGKPWKEDLAVEVWSTRVNEGSKTHAGIFDCADRLWAELRPRIDQILTSRSKTASALRVSFVGHSMGGLVLRSVSTKLHAASFPNVVLDTLVVIASPHLGCRLLGRGGGGGVAPLMSAFGPSLMRAGLRMIKGRTGPQLLLDNTALDTLTDDVHCAALRAFRRRIAYANGTGDWLVNCESSSLLSAEEMEVLLPLSTRACKQPGAGVVWRPNTKACEDAGLPPTLALAASPPAANAANAADTSGAHCIHLRPLISNWDPTATAQCHTTWDDGGGGRGERAARLLARLRACGHWELHLCHFFKRSSFAGGVFSPHIDLVALPHKISQPYGREVVEHMVARILESRGMEVAAGQAEGGG